MGHTMNFPLLSPDTQTNDGRNSYWFADQSKNSAAIRAALDMPIEEVLKLTEKVENPAAAMPVQDPSLRI